MKTQYGWGLEDQVRVLKSQSTDPKSSPKKIPKPRIVYRNTLTTGFRSGFWTYGATVLLMVTHCMHLANNSFDLKVKICF